VIKDFNPKMVDDIVVSVCEVAHLGLGAVLDLSLGELLDYYKVLQERFEQAKANQH
jgi:hypothetical protein